MKRHPRFIPTSSSLLHVVERRFGELTAKACAPGVFVSVDDLLAAIEDYVKVWNENPKPLVWPDGGAYYGEAQALPSDAGASQS